jgi:4,5-dihydroxyphthalate decarboxylase
MGPDFWSYGLEGNCETLETFVRYSGEQGLIKRRPSAEELFAAETREEFVI